MAISGCEPKNEPPTAILEVNPLSAEVPAEIRMQVTGEDPNGIEDIKEYVLVIGSESIKRNSPIDVTRTFFNVETIKIYGKVTDAENQSNKTEVKSIELVMGPYIEQTATLMNDTEISYSATIHKKTSAQLVIKRDGVSLLTIQIPDVNSTGIDYQKVFKYNSDGITKGNYEFILKADNLEKTTFVQILNYKPSVSLSGVNSELMEGKTKTITFPTPLDKNPEDNPVSIVSARPLDDKTQVKLSGYDITLTPLTYTGDYQVEVEFGSTAGGLEKAVLIGKITPEPWLYIINPFISTNPNGAAYDLLTTKAERNVYVQEKLFEDWADVYHIPPSFPPSETWVCTQYSRQLIINFHGVPWLRMDPVSGTFWNYYGFDLDSIYYYGGTLKDNGKYGLPVYSVYVSGGVTKHAMNAILTGDDITKFEDWCLIEPQRDSINVTPGHLYIPSTCYIEIRGIPKNREGEQFGLLPIAIFNIVNKVATFEQPWTDPNLKVIKIRE
jgi:hypothetical protein